MSDTDNRGAESAEPIDADPIEANSAPASDADTRSETASTDLRNALDGSDGSADTADAAATDTRAYDTDGKDADLARPVSASTSVSAKQAKTEWPAASDAPEPYTPSPAYTPGETYTPAASVGQPGLAAAPAVAQTPIYVQAPTPPTPKGNRAGGILIGLLAALAFALIYAAASFAVLMVRPDSGGVSAAADSFLIFVKQPVFWGTVIVFFLAFALLVAIVNRRGWVGYVLGGFGVGVLVYLGYIAVVVLQVRIWEYTPTEASQFLSVQWLSPVAIIAGVVAREVTVWFGAWVARRGRTVTARNTLALAEYDRLLEAGPRLTKI